MSLSRIQRINIDSSNFAANSTNVSLRVAMQNAIVKVPEAYNVVLEKAEIPISKIPLGILDSPHYIMIDYPPTAPDHPVLEKKLNIFSIQGEYYSILEFVRKINDIISFNLAPGVSCGSFSYDSEEHRLEYKFGSTLDRSTMALGVEMWFDSKLLYLLDGIDGVFAPTPDSTISSTLKMHKVTWTTFLNGEVGVVIRNQNRYLIPRLYGFKSIRIMSTLPLRPYIIYEQDKDKSIPSSLLAEIMMDSQNFIEGRSNQLYVPQNLIFSELTGVTEIKDFDLTFAIHYKNGKDHKLTVDPNEYLSVTLAFYKIKDV